MTPDDPTLFTLEPVAPADFVGRGAEVRLVLGRAHQSIPPLQSLEGPSKIGRTSMLLYLRAICRGDVPHESDAGKTPLIAPYIDLTLHPYEEIAAEQVVVEAIAAEIRDRGISMPDLSQGPAAISEVAAKMAELTSEDHSFLLLVDHVEHLLVRPDEPKRESWSNQATAALGELNERVRIAVLLAFGATGPARELRANARRLRMLETLDALSQILNRGNATRTALAPLDDSETNSFARRAMVPVPDGGTRHLSKTEIDWLVGVTGGHPLVMQNAGVRLAEAAASNDTEGQLSELERQLADPGLQGFMIDAFRRIGPLDEGSQAKLEDLADEALVDLEPGLAAGLNEEGLIQFKDEGLATMRSGGLREALRAYLEAAESIPPARGDLQPPRPMSSPTLALRDEEGGPELMLTRSEHALIKALLNAEGAGVASRTALKAALGPTTEDPKLTQRVSVLRQKIRRTLGVVDAIESVYGEGYRLTESGRYLLR